MDFYQVTPERDDLTREELLTLLKDARDNLRLCPQHMSFALLDRLDNALGNSTWDAAIPADPTKYETLLTYQPKALARMVEVAGKTIKDLEGKLELSYDAMSPCAKGSLKRDTSSITGWINELFLLAESNAFGATSSHVPYAMRLIAENIRRIHKEDVYLIGTMVDTVQGDMSRGLTNPTYNYVLDMSKPFIDRERASAKVKP